MDLNIIQRGMRCPRCVQQIHRAAAGCPHCGFTLADADERFGDEAVKLRRLTDAAGLFRRGERRRVEVALDRFGRRFPQLFAAVYTGSGGGSAHLRQFGFWMLNHAVFEDVPPEQPNSAGILIVLDPAAKAAAISFGYLLDPYLSQKDTFDCLSRAHAWWLEGRYCEGVVRVIAQMERVLRRRSRQARRAPDRFKRKVLPPARAEDLRGGRRDKASGGGWKPPGEEVLR